MDFIMKNQFSLYCTAFLFNLFCTVLHASDADYERFRREYAVEVLKLDESLKHVKGELILKTSALDKNGKRTKTTQDKGEFAVSGDSGKAILNVRRAAIGRSFEAVYVHCKQGDSFYMLTKRKGESAFAVENFGQNFPGSGKFQPVSFNMYCGQFLTASRLFLNADWTKALDAPNTTNIQVSYSDRDGRKICKLSYSGKNNPGSSSEFEFDTSCHYRILKSARIISGKPVYQFLVEYDPKLPDLTVPRKTILITPTEEMVCEFSALKMEPTPDEEFESHFFGVPEFEQNLQGNSLPYVWLMIAIAGTIAIVTLFIVGSRKKSIAA